MNRSDHAGGPGRADNLRRVWIISSGVALLALTMAVAVGAPSGRHIDHTVLSHSRASFAVKFKNETSPYRLLAAFVLPGERLELEAVSSARAGKYEVSATSGTLRTAGARSWQWVSPRRSGLYPVTVIQREPADSIRLNVFVMVPFSQVKDGYLNGYRMGAYPSAPLRGLPIYRRPRGFVEVTPANRRTPVSPHFRLEQFLCKQRADWPKYLVLSERLLLKLELILEKANEEGHRVRTLHVMSGYRTPYYNRTIGNVRYSRHVWGDAADIFIDEQPRDGRMDDLNGDGRIDVRDAGVLYDIIDRMSAEPWYTPFVGGLGRYRTTARHGPFVHVDARGFHARWGR